MSIDKVKAYFASLGMERRVLEFDVSSATVDLAAQALDVRPARIAKTLSFRIGEGCILIVTAGDAKIDNGKYKARFGTKARMLQFDEVEPMTGSAVGGVCPFALPPHVPVYLDASMKRFHTVFPACGSDNSAIELTCGELFTFSGAKEWVDVCKDWDETADPAYIETLLPDIGEPTDGTVSLRVAKTSPADVHTGFVPAYGFEILRCEDGQTVGAIDLRVGYCRNTYFGGNIGYQVLEPFRNNGYATRALKLVLDVARRQGMPWVFVSCFGDNPPSRAVIQSCGGVLDLKRMLPAYTAMYREGMRGEIRVYRIRLS